jgi:hypothetical protein
MTTFMRSRPTSKRLGCTLVCVGALLLAAACTADDSPRARDPLQAGLSPEQDAAVLRWLTCDECVEGELEYVVDSIGQVATPRLRQMLLELPDSVLANAEQGYASAWSRREAPLVDSAAYVGQFVSNLEATIQSRAVIALRELRGVAVLEEAYNARDSVGFRADVVAILEDALLELGGGGGGFSPPPVVRVVVRPLQVELVQGEDVYVEAVAVDSTGRARDVPISFSISDSAVAEPVDRDENWIRVRGGALGRVTVRATAAGVSGVSSVTVVLPGAAAGSVSIVSGDGQTFVLGAAHLPLVVRVADGNGVGIGGVLVAFRTIRGGPQTDSEVLTDADGQALLDLVLSDGPGPVWVDARVQDPRVTAPSVVRFRLRAVEP